MIAVICGQAHGTVYDGKRAREEELRRNVIKLLGSTVTKRDRLRLFE